MAKTTNPRRLTKETHKTRMKNHHQQQKQQPQLPSWAVMRSILTCKHLEIAQQQQQQQQQPKTLKNKQKKPSENPPAEETNNKKSKKMRCSGSLCNNTKVMQKPEPVSPETLQRKNRTSSSSTPPPSSSNNEGSKSNHPSIKTHILREISNNNHSLSNNGVLLKSSSASIRSIKGMPFSKFSGCYECRMVVDPVFGFTRDPSLRATICSCPDCGEVFMKPENLELHQAVRHAVSELGPEDTSKNIVEIIFQSSWLEKQTPVCQIERILKVHNTQRTINKFEEYRDLIKFKATKLSKKYPRCIADGNELLRFHCTTFRCSLGLNGSSNLCNSTPHCNVCNIIKSGFKVLGGEGLTEKGILTTATSGRAHDRAEVGLEEGERRAMLVCRVIAGRVKKTLEVGDGDVGGGDGGGGLLEEYDSVATTTGVYSNLDELYVFNPKAILPCFVVIYRGF